MRQDSSENFHTVLRSFAEMNEKVPEPDWDAIDTTIWGRPIESRQKTTKQIIEHLSEANTHCKVCSKCLYGEKPNRETCFFLRPPIKTEFEEPVCDFETYINFQLPHSEFPLVKQEVGVLLQMLCEIKQNISVTAPAILSRLINDVVDYIDGRCLQSEKKIDILLIYKDIETLQYRRSPESWASKYLEKKHKYLFEEGHRPMPDKVANNPIIKAAKNCEPPLIIENCKWTGSQIMLATLIHRLFSKKHGRTDWKLVDKVFLINDVPVPSKNLRDAFYTEYATPCESELKRLLPELEDKE